MMGPIAKRKGVGVDTELLRTFVAVVGGGSFTAAARELGYVQSTVTGHVQTLERRFGARLLDRLPTGAVPTDAGRRLIPYAEHLLDLQTRMFADVPGTRRPAGPVRLTAPESLCAYRLPALIAALRAEEPDVRLSLTPSGTAAALEAVRRGTTDIALLLEPALTASDVVLEPLGTEEIVLLAAPSAVDTEEPSTWADLANSDTLLLEDGCSYSDDVARHLLTAGQPATRRTRFGSIEAIKRCAAAGLGWTVLPAVTAEPELGSHTLAILPGPHLPACIVHSATHHNRWLGPAAQLVLGRLRNLWAAQP
jgi:DNA-binding transcriptional LysR family regulator